MVSEGIFQLEAAEEIGTVDAIQPPFNLIHRDAAAPRRRAARRHARRGGRSPGQVDGWLPAATLELKDDDLADIADAIQVTGAGTGPGSPVR